MKMTPEQAKRLFYLFGVLREETITGPEISELNAILETQPEARAYYIDYVYLCTDLYNLQAAISHNNVFWDIVQESQCVSGSKNLDESSFLLEAMKLMGEEEKKAQVLAIPQKKEIIPEKSLADRLEKPRKINKVSLYTAIWTTAALVMMVIYAHLNSQPSQEVATLSDSINAEWNSGLSLSKGVRVTTEAHPVKLQKGIIELISDEDVRILIEGPAEFRFTSPSQMILNYGRVYSSVSQAGRGFTVQTPLSKVIDLGTEFGVLADMRGGTELHVFKGKTVFIGQTQKNGSEVLNANTGQALRLDRLGEDVKTIALDENVFVRTIDSTSQVVWRGQKSLDLADMVGGGAGTGTGMRNMAIPWDGQKLVRMSEIPAVGSTSKSYVPVDFTPFIDGIFIPSSKGEAVRISSKIEDLKLDEFLRQDTNGVITLMMIKESSDDISTYWFLSKEGAAGDRAKMPFLYFPKGSNGQPVTVTTADGQGADTYISNDARDKANRRFGITSSLHCRYFKDTRFRMICLRFDISQVKDLSGAVLNLALGSGNRDRTLNVYGLKDGPADFWDENTIDYATTPGLKTAPAGAYAFDENAYTKLGTFIAADTRKTAQPIKVTSDGLFKWTAPQLLDQSAYAITNADSFPDSLSPDKRVPLRLGNKLCGGQDNPSILMHANAGITFNLDAIRKAYGSLKSFTAFCGLSPSALRETDTGGAIASFYVLLDGQEVFSAEDLTAADSPQTINLGLTGQQHYLTLITTQGEDGSIDNDLCLFARPSINIE
jgi:hypothetical protein